MIKENLYDVIIVGGGIMGCAAAYCLIAGDGKLKIAVLEKDPTYSHASTTLSMANVRTQFGLKENILVSRYAVGVFEKFDQAMAVAGSEPRIHFRREGNLFLAAPGNREAARKSLALQQSLGCRVEWWPPGKIKERFPFYEPAGLAGGTFGACDGHLDAHSLLAGYRKKAAALGVTFITGEVREITTACRGSGAPPIYREVTGVKTAAGKSLAAKIAINCAGAWAAQIARTANVKLPVYPTRRQVFVLDTVCKPPNPLPLTVLPSGLYFRTDTGGVIILGKSMPDDPVGFDFSLDHDRFAERLWPELAAFVPPFDRLKLLRGWAGLYAQNTFDGNAILGEWPECKGFYLANGFSGHGLQQAPAVGRYLSERILGKKTALDLSRFGPQRILDNKPLSEHGLV